MWEKQDLRECHITMIWAWAQGGLFSVRLQRYYDLRLDM